MTPDRHGIAVRRIGGAARAVLAPGRRGVVLAVFRRSFYVELGDGALACIGPAAMGAGPLNVLACLSGALDWPASGLAAGAPAHVERRTLSIDGRFEFALDGAVEWSPTGPADGWSRQSLAEGVAALRRAARRHDLSDGLARLVVSDGPADDMLIERGREGVAALLDWMTDERGDAPSAKVADLVGLGPGLTPSGDDFIGGAMIALGALGHEERATALGDWVLPIAGTRTGKISLAHLSCAADGEGAAALHEAIAAVAAIDRDGIAAAIAGLDRIGHSSGWDALAGAVAVMAKLGA